jgi:hypothetical protein
MTCQFQRDLGWRNGRPLGFVPCGKPAKVRLLEDSNPRGGHWGFAVAGTPVCGHHLGYINLNRTRMSDPVEQPVKTEAIV